MNLSADEEKEFCRLLKRIGKGMRLRVPHDGPLPGLVPDPRGFPEAGKPEPVSHAMVRHLIRSGLLWKMTEQTIGDSQSFRIGWKEAGMDGDVADWYVYLV